MFKKLFSKKKVAKEPIKSSREEIIEKLREFVLQRQSILGKDDLLDDTVLFSSGILSSLTFIELVAFIEQEFNIILSDYFEVSVENMDSIITITDKLTAPRQ